MSTMVQCHACGAQHDSDDVFCPRCGAASSATATTSSGETRSPAPDAAGKLLSELEEALAPGIQAIRPLGSGGMGMVFAGRDPALKRQVAIKVLLPEFANDDTSRRRFEREAEAAASVAHPNVVSIYQIGILPASKSPYFVMQYIDGVSLAEAFPQGKPASLPHVKRILGDVASALSAAHARGLIHRDIKPANIMIENGTGRTVVLDFGISAVLDEKRRPNEPKLTATGNSIGTPAYMSPEQAAAEPTTDRTDVYSLGCVGFELLTGRPPFVEQNAWALMAAHIKDKPAAVAELRPDLPAEIARSVDSALAKDPNQRPAALDIARAMGHEQADVREWPPPGTEDLRRGAIRFARVLPVFGFVMLSCPLLLALAPAQSWSAWDPGESSPFWQSVEGVFGSGTQVWLFSLSLLLAVSALAAIAVVLALGRIALAGMDVLRLGYPLRSVLQVLSDWRADTAALINGSERYAIMSRGARATLLRIRRSQALLMLACCTAAAAAPILWTLGIPSGFFEDVSPASLPEALTLTLPAIALLLVWAVLRGTEAAMVAAQRPSRGWRRKRADSTAVQMADAWLARENIERSSGRPRPAWGIIPFAAGVAFTIAAVIGFWALVMVAAIGPGRMAIDRSAAQEWHWLTAGSSPRHPQIAALDSMFLRVKSLLRPAASGTVFDRQTLTRLLTTPHRYEQRPTALALDDALNRNLSPAAGRPDLDSVRALAREEAADPLLPGFFALADSVPAAFGDSLPISWALVRAGSSPAASRANQLTHLAYKALSMAALSFSEGNVSRAHDIRRRVRTAGLNLMRHGNPALAQAGFRISSAGSYHLRWGAFPEPNAELDGSSENEARVRELFGRMLNTTPAHRRTVWGDVNLGEGRRIVWKRDLAPAVRVYAALGIVDGFCMNARELLFGPSNKRDDLIAHADSLLADAPGARPALTQAASTLGLLRADPQAVVESHSIPRRPLFAPLSLIGLGAVRARLDFCTWRN